MYNDSYTTQALVAILQNQQAILIKLMFGDNPETKTEVAKIVQKAITRSQVLLAKMLSLS